MNPYLLYSLAFFLGGNAYCFIELLYRARTHYSMFFCAGIAVAILLFVYTNNRSLSPVVFALIAALTITALEFLFGVVFNLYLHMGVWDYSRLPLNLFGQVCVPFCVIWFFFGTALFYIFRVLKV